MPVTWAVVGQLLARERDTRDAPGPDALWYAPDLIDEIRSARQNHEIAFHGYTHADLWFHPSNFYHQTETQFGILAKILEDASQLRAADRLEARTLGSFMSS